MGYFLYATDGRLPATSGGRLSIPLVEVVSQVHGKREWPVLIWRLKNDLQ